MMTELKWIPDYTTLNEAIDCAEKFIRRAKEVHDNLGDLVNSEYEHYSTAKIAAMKRASMDLTKSLVPLRKDNSHLGKYVEVREDKKNE